MLVHFVDKILVEHHAERQNGRQHKTEAKYKIQCTTESRHNSGRVALIDIKVNGTQSRGKSTDCT